MKHTNILYGIVGMCVGAGLVLAFTSGEAHRAPQMHDMDMTSSMQSMTSGLSGKTGDEFDQAFLSEMIVHHQGAVDMAQQVLATSKRPELLQLAHDIIAAQTKEIGMMQGWQKAWYK
jgi:uncharacterized protein (DUF305 family)